MNDFRMELRAIEASRIIGDHGKGRALCGRNNAKTGRKRCHLVAMAHPDLMARALFPKPVKQQAFVGNVDKGTAKFTAVPGLHRAAQLLRHGLLAIANAQDWKARVKQALRRARGACFGHGGGAA